MTTARVTRVYQFGARPPEGESMELLRDQVRKAHDYRAVLVKLENERRAKEAEVYSELFPEIARLKGELEELKPRIEAADAAAKAERRRRQAEAQGKRTTRSKAKKPVPEGPSLAELRRQRKQLTDQLRVHEKAARQQMEPPSEEFARRYTAALTEILRKRGQVLPNLKKAGPRLKSQARSEVAQEMLQEPHPELWLRLTAIREATLAACKAARSVSGLSPGTYIWVENAVRAAAKTTPLSRRVKHSRKNLCLGVQITAKSPPETSLELPSFPPEQWDTRPGRRHAFGMAGVRIARSSEEKPMCRLSIVQHRPLPEDAKLKWAYIRVRRQGLRFRYWLQLTLGMPRPVRIGPRREDAVAVDLGWRSTPRGVRVAYCYGSDGVEEEVLLPKKVATRLAFSQQLRSTADTAFAAVCKQLQELRKAGTLPEWLTQATDKCWQWQRHSRLGALVPRLLQEALPDHQQVWNSWRRERLAAKKNLWVTSLEEAAEWMGGTPLQNVAFWLLLWDKQDRHLVQWSVDEATRARALRLNTYRVLAKRLAQRYERVVVEDSKKTASGVMDLTPFAVIPDHGEETDQERNARATRVMVAPFILRMTLANAFGKLCKATTKFSTKRCHACHCICDFDAATELTHRCEHCGAVWDQDANAARNLLSEYAPLLAAE